MVLLFGEMPHLITPMITLFERGDFMGSRQNLSNRQMGKSIYQSTTDYLKYYNKFREIAISVFKWKNLPKTCDSRFLELSLLNKNSCLFFYDENGDFYGNLPFTGQNFDIYGNFIERKVYADNGYNATFYPNNSTIIYNNNLRNNMLLDLRNFAERLALIDKIIDCNVNAQKQPLLLTCSESQRLSMINFFKKYDGCEPAIFVNDNFNADCIKAVKTDSIYIADKLQTLKRQIYNDCLTFLGVNNVDDKKERRISAEIDRENADVIAYRNSRLDCRVRACEEINEKFGLNLSVSYNG